MVGSPHQFLTGSGRIDAADAPRILEIARKHEATFFNPDIPGRGYRYWFACQDLGEPSNSKTCAAVETDLNAANIRLPGR